MTSDEYCNWKKDFQQLESELDDFKGTKKQRHEIFGNRIDHSYNRLLQIKIKVLNKLL